MKSKYFVSASDVKKKQNICWGGITGDGIARGDYSGVEKL
jgi:hypothetical protein